MEIWLFGMPTGDDDDDWLMWQAAYWEVLRVVQEEYLAVEAEVVKDEVFEQVGWER